MAFLKYTLSLISQRLLNIIRCESGCDNCLQNGKGRIIFHHIQGFCCNLKKRSIYIFQVKLLNSWFAYFSFII